MGLSQQSLSRLVAAQKLKRVGHGIYLHPEAELDQDVGFQIACAKFGPEDVIGGLSALFHYNLAEQVPGHVWGIVPAQKKGYRIVSVERAILEGLK